MYDIFKSEFKRYQKWALLLMIGHFSAAWFSHRIGLLWMDENSPVFGAQWLSALMGGFLFGLLQIGLHKKPSQWTYLIHRPLSSTQIFLALLLAAATLVALVLFIPTLLIIGSLDMFTEHVVDARHYVFPFQIFGIAICSAMLGNYTQLYPNKMVFLTVSLLSYFMVTGLYTTPISTIIPMTVASIWLFYLCKKAFKPDLTRHFDTVKDTVIASFPVQMSLSFAGVFLQLLYHLPLLIAGAHPDNNPVADSYDYFRFYLDEAESAVYFLNKIDTGQSKELARQAKFGDAAMVNYAGASGGFPVKNNMLMQDEHRFYDANDNTMWAFSHDHMLFKGFERSTGLPKGWIGRNGFYPSLNDIPTSEYFSDIPQVVRQRFIVTRDNVNRINFDDKLVEPIFTLQADEKLLGGVSITESFASIMTNKRFYLFDRDDFNASSDNLKPEYMVEHPDGMRSLEQIFTVKVVDGYVVTYIDDPDYIEDDIITKTYMSRLGGKAEFIGDYHFSRAKHPAFILHDNFIVSPALLYLDTVIFSLIAPEQNDSSTKVGQRPVPDNIVYIAVVVGLLSTLAVWFLAGRFNLPRNHRLAWTVVTLITGLPGLISLFILTDWREQLRKKKYSAALQTA
jgi:hypothetical protein